MSDKAKRVSDVIGDGKVSFYPDLPKVKVEDILGKDVMIMDAKIMRDWEGEWGKSSWCLLWVQDAETGEGSTTKCGGVVLVKRVQELIDQKCFPIIGAIVMETGGEFPYYNIK